MRCMLQVAAHAASFPSFSVDKGPYEGLSAEILTNILSLIAQINKVMYNFRKVNYQTRTKACCIGFYTEHNYGIYLKITSNQTAMQS